MNDEPELSIVVVNWNVRDLLDACLSSIERFVPSSGGVETIVVDNASGDGSAEMVRTRHPGTRLVENTENVGFGRANNQALGLCRGRFVLLLNPDARVMEGAIQALVGAIRGDDRVGVAGARLLNPDGTFQRGCGGALPTLGNIAGQCLKLDRLLPHGLRPPSLFYDEEEAGRRPMEWVSGAAMILRRSALGDRIFDERFFMYGEDMELCRRIARSGLVVRFVPEARVTHHMSASMERQTSDEVYASIVKGPRAYFRMAHGPMASFLFDAIMLCGYVVRWVGFGVLGALAPGRGHGKRALDSRRAAVAAARVMAWRSAASEPARSPGADRAR